MTMEKRGVIDENTPSGGCCGGSPDCKNKQLIFKFGETIEPTTEKEADDMASSPLADAIDAVVEETDKDAE